MMKHFRNELFLAVALFLLLITAGTFSYHWIENYPWVDALYMTIITATTVGFGEVHPLDDMGKIITITLILSSIIIYGYAITVITEYVIGENIFKKLLIKRMEKRISNLNGHMIIAGYGRTGKQAAQKLKNYNKKVVIIDLKKDEDDKLIDDENVYFLEGDATKDKTLQKAGIYKAKSLLTTLPTDANNLFIVLSGRQLNPDLKIVTRAATESTANKMKLAGANQVILPEVISGEFMASLVVAPDLVEFLNALSIQDADHTTHMEEIHFRDLPPEYHGQSIAKLDLRRKTGCTVIGYKTPDHRYIINPSADTKLEKGSAIIVLGQPEQIEKLHGLFK